MKNDAGITSVTGLKFCHCCGLVRMVSDYHRRSRSVDGLQARCKTCHIESVKARLNLDRVRESSREYARRKRVDPAFRKSEAERKKLYRARMKADR